MGVVCNAERANDYLYKINSLFTRLLSFLKLFFKAFTIIPRNRVGQR